MSHLRTHSRLLVVAVSCLALGAGAGAIASAGAATGSTASTPAGHARLGPLRRFAARAVQGTAVIHTAHGFVTVSWNRGTVKSVDGQQLTLVEGTPKAAYRTVTLTIPAGAVVRDNRSTASLSALAPGERAIVVVAPKRTLVIARTPRAT
ncbi:MAG: hypothetical protein ABSH51_11875 [Solirubrobacteraceae bacterium]